MFDDFIEAVCDLSEFLYCFGALLLGMIIFFGLYKCWEVFYDDQLKPYGEPWYKALFYWVQDTWARIVLGFLVILATLFALYVLYLSLFVWQIFS